MGETEQEPVSSLWRLAEQELGETELVRQAGLKEIRSWLADQVNSVPCLAI